MGAILFKIHRLAHCQVQWSCDFYNCRHGLGILAGRVTSRLTEIYLHGIRHRTCPMETLTYGNGSCQWHFPEEVGLSLHWIARSYWNRWWYDHLWEKRAGVWQKSTPIPQDYQEEWIGSQQIETTIQEARSTLLWTSMEFTWNHSRPQEDRFNP